MKKRLWKGVLSVVLCLALALPAMTFKMPKVLAEEDENGFVITNGELLSYRGTETDVVIPETVTKIGEMAFNSNENLTSVKMNDNVTSIGKLAFAFCTNLSEVVLSSNLTEIGDNAFQTCRKLKSITLPASVTHIGACAFGLCGLTEISIPEGVTAIEDGTFQQCGSLKKVVIPSTVTNIGSRVFAECLSLKEIELPKELKIVEERLFSGCVSLTNIVIPSGVEEIGERAFEKCDGLTDVTLPGGITAIGAYAFSECKKLSSVSLQNGILTIGEGSFSYCENLESVIIPRTVKSIGYGAFCMCYNLATVVINEGVEQIGKMAFYWCEKLKEVDIPSTVKAIGDRAFMNCFLLNKATIRDGVGTIGKECFMYSRVLLKVGIPESGYEIDSSSFEGCANLTIYGVEDSFAQTYAEALDIPFLLLNSDGTIPDDPNPVSIDTCSVTLDEDVVIYNGSEKMPYVTVTDNGRILSEGTDYSLTYSNNVDSGTAYVKVSGAGDYTGTVSKTFTITAKPISGCNVALGSYSAAYDGSAKTPSVTMTDDNKALALGVDYTFEYKDNINVGTAQIIIIGKGNYTGTVTKTFTITDAELKNISTCHFSEISPRTYTGEDFFPKMIVKDGTTVLLQDTDYMLTYSGNRYAGTASVYVIGIGDYSGSVTRRFEIRKADQTLNYTKASKKVYGANAFYVNAVRTSGEGSLSYSSSNKNVATVNSDGKVTIKGTGAATITVTAAETSNYKAKSVKITLTVSPDRQTVKSLATAKGRKLTVKWKKDARATGYQIQYSTKKNFSGAKTVTIGKNTTTSKTLTKLTKGKRYYVRVRSYKTAIVNGKTTKLYGAWSSAKRSGGIRK